MYNADWYSKKFIDGLHYVLDVAKANKMNGLMCCLCEDCQNKKDCSSSITLHRHIVANGFMSNYICWTSRGKKGVGVKYSSERTSTTIASRNANRDSKVIKTASYLPTVLFWSCIISPISYSNWVFIGGGSTTPLTITPLCPLTIILSEYSRGAR